MHVTKPSQNQQIIKFFVAKAKRRERLKSKTCFPSSSCYRQSEGRNRQTPGKSWREEYLPQRMSSPISPHPKTRQGKPIIKTVARLKPEKTSSHQECRHHRAHAVPPKSAFLEKKKNKINEGRGDEGRGSEREAAREGLVFLGRASFPGKHSVQLRRPPRPRRSGSSCW